LIQHSAIAEGDCSLSDHLPIPFLPDVIIEPLVRLALSEDLGRGGDITTDAVIPASARMQLRSSARAKAASRRAMTPRVWRCG
jgi:hypothetical protein